jgi:flagellar protein FlaG
VRDSTSPRATSRTAGETPAEQQADSNLDLNSVQAAAAQVEKFVSRVGSDLSFSVDRETGINVVTVVDRNTKEVIRQIPSREIIQIAQALDKVQGLLIRNQA